MGWAHKLRKARRLGAFSPRRAPPYKPYTLNQPHKTAELKCQLKVKSKKVAHWGFESSAGTQDPDTQSGVIAR